MNGEVSDLLVRHGPVVVVVGLFLGFMLKMWSLLGEHLNLRDRTQENMTTTVTKSIDRNTTALNEVTKSNAEVKETIRTARQDRESLQRVLDRLARENTGD